MQAYVRNPKTLELELADVPQNEVCPVMTCGRNLRFTGERHQHGMAGGVAWEWDCGRHRFIEVKNNQVLGYDKKVRIT